MQSIRPDDLEELAVGTRSALPRASIRDQLRRNPPTCRFLDSSLEQRSRRLFGLTPFCAPVFTARSSSQASKSAREKRSSRPSRCAGMPSPPRPCVFGNTERMAATYSVMRTSRFKSPRASSSSRTRQSARMRVHARPRQLGSRGFGMALERPGDWFSARISFIARSHLHVRARVSRAASPAVCDEVSERGPEAAQAMEGALFSAPSTAHARTSRH